LNWVANFYLYFREQDSENNKLKFAKIYYTIQTGKILMKQIFILCLTSLLILTHCQKKEEPKVQTLYSPGPVHGEAEITLLQERVKQNPKDVSAWIELGNILMDTSRFPGAIAAYQKALELDPKNVDARVDMGTCYRNIGEADRAAQEYRKAIAINPTHLKAHRNLGVVLAFDLRDKKQAIKEFEEYLRLSPNAPDAYRVRQEIARLKTTQ
jgi:cytochrome c-type biogenesis protein CcmH/NrfG